MKRRWLAVIGEHEIHVAKVAIGKNKKMKVLFISEYHFTETEQGESGEIYSSEFEGIKNWLQGLSVPIKKLKFAISSLGMITRVIALPQMSHPDLEKLITDHSDQYFTLNVANYMIDYRILDQYWENERQMNRVLLAAVPKLRMQSIWSLTQYLGFEPVVIDLTADCLARIYGDLTEKTKTIRLPDSDEGAFPGDIAVVSVHGDKIELVLLENGIFFLYSDLKLNVRAISEKLKHMMNKQIEEDRMSDDNPSETNALSTQDGGGKELSLTSEKDRHELEETHLENSQETFDDDSYDDLLDLTQDLPKINFSIDKEIGDTKEVLLHINQGKKEQQEFMLHDLFVPMEDLDERLPLFKDEFLGETKVTDTAKRNIFDQLDLNMVAESLEEKTMEFLEEDPKEELENALSPLLSTLSELLSFFAARHFGQNIHSIYLTGTFCTLPYLGDVLSENLGVQTVVGFPNDWKPAFKGISQMQIEKWQCYGSLYGLALRED